MTFPARDQSHEGGFTLVEILVALFIFSLISVGSLSAMSTSLQGKAQIEAQTDKMRQLDLARAIMVADMSALESRAVRDPLGGYEPYIFEGGSDVLMRFTRNGRDNPGALAPRGDVQRVEYIFESGQLIRRARLNANPAQNTGYTSRTLLDGLTAAELRFDSPAGITTQVLIPRGGNAILPPVTTLILTFENGDTLTQNFRTSF